MATSHHTQFVLLADSTIQRRIIIELSHLLIQSVCGILQTAGFVYVRHMDIHKRDMNNTCGLQSGVSDLNE